MEVKKCRIEELESKGVRRGRGGAHGTDAAATTTLST